MTRWKKGLAEYLKTHKDISNKATGQVEVNLNVGGVTKVYLITKTVKGDTTVFVKKEIK